MAVAPAQLKDVREDEAEGQIKATYEDIKATLRVPFVSRVFLLLANYPDAFQLLWRQLKPNAQTVYFERQADELRRLSVESVVGGGKAPSPESEEQTNTLKMFNYALPKVLLAVTVLGSAVKGQYPRLEELSLDDKRQIERGVPTDMPSVTEPNGEAAHEETGNRLEQLRSALGASHVPLSITALAAWPRYLDGAADSLQKLLGKQEIAEWSRSLGRAATEAALIMPFRVEANPHVLRRVGLSEAEIDSVQDILHNASRLLPKLILANGFLTVGATESQSASQSPYPVTTL